MEQEVSSPGTVVTFDCTAQNHSFVQYYYYLFPLAMEWEFGHVLFNLDLFWTVTEWCWPKFTTLHKNMNKSHAGLTQVLYKVPK